MNIFLDDINLLRSHPFNDSIFDDQRKMRRMWSEVFLNHFYVEKELPDGSGRGDGHCGRPDGNGGSGAMEIYFCKLNGDGISYSIDFIFRAE